MKYTQISVFLKSCGRKGMYPKPDWGDIIDSRKLVDMRSWYSIARGMPQFIRSLETRLIWQLL